MWFEAIVDTENYRTAIELDEEFFFYLIYTLGMFYMFLNRMLSCTQPEDTMSD